ncbi:hypothetical protein SteCoe_8825 [Stentor coeruleus]|uniref:Uncharacterized protein n=1 Tax=Stentor coeruleus TaxID=5963 RepID=A0A1R2CJC7_9CILI|nr:hypothetical protein SteCoe_8825 [Stentor coeruleus]
MNKYTDFKIRHSSTRSLPVFPDIKLTPFTIENTSRIPENGHFSVYSESSTKGFLEYSKAIQETMPQKYKSEIKNKPNSNDYSKELTVISSLNPFNSTTDSGFSKSKNKKSENSAVFHSSSSDSKVITNLTRPKTISDFSARQNEIINSFLTPIEVEYKKFKPLPEIASKTTLPTDREFSKLIDNLNEVVSPKSLKTHTTLQENEITEVTISESKLKFFKIYMKHRKVPLSIKIKRNKGKLYIYASTATQEPGPTNYEKVFMSDYFEIRDSSTLFKYDLLYLGIKAFEESQFKISIAFGHQIISLQEQKKLKRQSIRINSQEPIEIDEEVEETTKETTKETIKDNIKDTIKEPIKDTIKETIKNITKSEPRLKKNFIAANKHKSIDFIDKINIFTIRGADWKTRREQILQKKKELFEIKKSKALDSVNKRTLRLKMERIKAQESKVKTEKNQFSSNWLELISFFTSAQAIYNIIKTEKNKRLRRISMSLKAIQIQTVYKNYTLNLKPDEAALFRSRNLLAFYRGSTKDIEKCFGYGYEIISSIKQASHAQVVFRKFSHFYKSVIMIQRNTRKYLSRKESRMKELIKMWGVVCECMLFRKGSKKEDRKRQSLDIVAIPMHIRDKILGDYYKNCMMKYRKKLREYDKMIRNLSEGKLFKTVIMHVCNNQPPEFEFVPTTSEMEKMIEVSMVTRL